MEKGEDGKQNQKSEKEQGAKQREEAWIAFLARLLPYLHNNACSNIQYVQRSQPVDRVGGSEYENRGWDEVRKGFHL